MALARWYDAVERACTEALYDDAANWLYAIRQTTLQYGPIVGDPDDNHRLALALRASGTGTVIPEPYSARERALTRLRDKKWPDALEELRRYLWRAVITADWTSELDANRLLGELYAATGRPEDATRHFIHAGDGRKLKDLAHSLPDAQVTLGTELLGETPWERAAAFTFAAEISDLLIDTDGASWASLAAADVMRNSPQRRSILAADPFLAAFNAFGRLSTLSTPKDAAAFLSYASDLVPREANTYRQTDEGHVQALIGIADAHAELRSAAVGQLLDVLLVDSHMADLVLRGGADLLRAEASLVNERLDEQARAGHFHACLGIIVAEVESDAPIELAHRRLETAIAPRVHTPGSQSFGTSLQTTGLLVTILGEEAQQSFAEAMIKCASDIHEPALNRREALLALVPLGETFPAHGKSNVFESALGFAKGDYEPSEGFFASTDDPLSRFRVNLGSTSLPPEGLLAAASFASTDAQYIAIETLAREMLAGADEQTCRTIAQALARIPPGCLTLDIELLAIHSSEWVRALAAVLWANQHEGGASLGVRLARDPSRHVRGTLAASLTDSSSPTVTAILVEDPRRSIRMHVRPRADSEGRG
jgi:hypothetical protein